ncbi:helix-turn-helix domain-containing protein [Runella limosa]|uniref:helix-turn-helix domain-containing protein n=1 Tax=Runella limosa TaxID=370978 RepID=UPI0004920AFA|nr:AraC family transcriptional regulator [Runella limosa]
MRRYVLHNPFNIYHFEASDWEHPVHKHTYYEIIFILRGKGIHNINGNTYTYTKGDVYLLGPEDFHDFDIEETTEFCFIRFNESYSKTTSSLADKQWQHVLELLLFTSSQSRGTIVHDKLEKQKLHQLLSVLESEYDNPPSAHFELIRDSLMRSIMTILARNLSPQPHFKPELQDSIEAMLRFIKQNIYQPNKLTIDHIAEQFHLAPAYVSIFFKKHTGESLKQYIIKHRIKLVETRLLYSQMTLTEIADEFGFTDESHFCKQFRQYTGVNPSTFRKNGQTFQ